MAVVVVQRQKIVINPTDTSFSGDFQHFFYMCTRVDEPACLGVANAKARPRSRAAGCEKFYDSEAGVGQELIRSVAGAI